MNYESTLEEAESHTRNCDPPRVVSALDKSDKPLSLVSVNAKQRNVLEPKRLVDCLSGGLVHYHTVDHSGVRGRGDLHSPEPSRGMLGHCLSQMLKTSLCFLYI